MVANIMHNVKYYFRTFGIIFAKRELINVFYNFNNVTFLAEGCKQQLINFNTFGVTMN